MPRKLLYFAVIEAWALATTKKYPDKSPDQVSWTEVCIFLDPPARGKAANPMYD